MLGTPFELPFLLAPVGSSRMFYPRGEEAAARAAGERRHRLHPVDVVRLPAGGRQGGDDGPALVSALSGRRPRRRAEPRSRAREAAGYSALVVTIDTPVAGMRERDVRNGVKQLLAQNVFVDAAVPAADASRGRAGCVGFFATAA